VSSTLGRWWISLSGSCKYLGASVAINLVKRKLGRRPHDWSLWLMLGRLYAIGYQWSQAIEALKRARKLNPSNEVVAQVLAKVKEEARQNGAWPPGKKEKSG
jgi:uncharacterized protein HemY